MGALLHSAVSLIGRETDLITHVLVAPPYDALPGFFYPNQPACPLHDSRSGRAHLAADAEITLAEVPFVPLRNRFKDLEDLPASFLSFRDSVSLRLKQDAERQIPIRIDHSLGLLTVDGKSHSVRARALAVLHFVLQANLDGKIPPDQTSAAENLAIWYSANRKTLGHIESPNFDDSDIRRELNHLRVVLKHAPWQPALRTLAQAPFRLL
jgi:CRISPR-associated protein NE0113 (Cas_NE0113)